MHTERERIPTGPEGRRTTEDLRARLLDRRLRRVTQREQRSAFVRRRPRLARWTPALLSAILGSVESIMLGGSPRAACGTAPPRASTGARRRSSRDTLAGTRAGSPGRCRTAALLHGYGNGRLRASARRSCSRPLRSSRGASRLRITPRCERDGKPERCRLAAATGRETIQRA